MVAGEREQSLVGVLGFLREHGLDRVMTPVR
jgi:hypothetical protein